MCIHFSSKNLFSISSGQFLLHHRKRREFQKNSYFCFIHYAKAFDCMDHNKLWKVLKEMGIPDHLTCLQRNLYADQEQLEPNMKQVTGSILGKEYVEAVYCHPAYLTLSRVLGWMNHVKCHTAKSCKMPGWMNQKLGSRLPREISITSDMQMTPHLWQKVKKK